MTESKSVKPEKKYLADLLVTRTDDEQDRPHSFNDEPAAVYSNGIKFWFKHDERHRDNDQPAEVYPDCHKVWYQHGRGHRDNDLPAEIRPNGTTIGYQDDKLHRLGEPAITWLDGYEEYCEHGFFDRGVTPTAIIEGNS